MAIINREKKAKQIKNRNKQKQNKNNQDVINIFLTIFCNLNTPTSITDGESIINDNRLSIDDNAHTYSGNHYREMMINIFIHHFFFHFTFSYYS